MNCYTHSELIYARQVEPHDQYGLDYASSVAYPTQEASWETSNTDGVTQQEVYHADYEEQPSSTNTDEDTGSNSSSAS